MSLLLRNVVTLKFLMAKSVKKTGEAVKRKMGRDETAIFGKKRKTDDGTWEDSSDLHVYTAAGVESRSKVAAFDIDGTIITTKSGRTFAKDENDWQFLYSEVPGKLKGLWEDGYKIVFVTNQKGLDKGKVSLSGFKHKVEAILSKIAAPIQVFVSPGSLRFRKPYTGMWQELTENRNKGVDVDVNQSFYVGDAAGRHVSQTRKKKDFSCGDRLFALNVGLKFRTPEQFFLDKSKEEPHSLPEFDPRKVSNETPLLEPSSAQLTIPPQEVIVMVGYPGSGKSHFVKQHLESKSYVVVNRDTLKTWQKCVAAGEEALKKGKSVVVDNTNPDKESRSRYTEMAKKAAVPCRCFLMNVSHAQANHNNRFRIILGTDKEHKEVNEMVMNMHKSKFVEPATDEGFSEVVRVNFVPEFNDEHKRNTYKMFLCEK